MDFITLDIETDEFTLIKTAIVKYLHTLQNEGNYDGWSEHLTNEFKTAKGLLGRLKEIETIDE